MTGKWIAAVLFRLPSEHRKSALYHTYYATCLEITEYLPERRQRLEQQFSRASQRLIRAVKASVCTVCMPSRIPMRLETTSEME